MAASIKIHEKNTVSETATDKTSGNVRFKQADNATVDLNNPMTIPDSGYVYSYEKWFQLYISSGTFTQISNLRVYTDGANGFGTGIELFFAVDASFSTPVQPSNANHPPQHDAVSMVDAFTYTSGSPLDIDASDAGPFDSSSLPKYIGDYLVAVAAVDSTASQGSKTGESITFAWDEI